MAEPGRPRIHVEVWHRLPGETKQAYARFLWYRNLGPTRSVKTCYYQYLKEKDNYQGTKKGITVPTRWHRECTKNKWVDRAASWDIRNLTRYGARIVALHSQTITLLAMKNRRVVGKTEHGTKEWNGLMEGISRVAEYVNPELLKNVQEQHRGGGDDNKSLDEADESTAGTPVSCLAERDKPIPITFDDHTGSDDLG